MVGKLRAHFYSFRKVEMKIVLVMYLNTKSQQKCIKIVVKHNKDLLILL